MKTVFSLKSRLVIILIFSSFLPILLIGLTSYFSIFHLVEKNYNLLLEQEVSSVCAQIDSLLDNLAHASQQMVFEGTVGDVLKQYFTEPSAAKQKALINQIDRQITLVEFSNPGLGGITYFYRNKEGELVPINNSLVRQKPNPGEKGLTAEDGKSILFFGPHPTKTMKNDYMVLSIHRQIDVEAYPEIVVYIETGFKKLQNILLPQEQDPARATAILRGDGTVAYSDSTLVSEGDTLSGGSGEFRKLSNGELYYTVGETSKYGWTLVKFLPKSAYDAEKANWARNYIFISLLCILCSFVMAYFIWRMVYAPTRRFYKALKEVAEDGNTGQIQSLNVQEYDDNLALFGKMKAQIIQLMDRVEAETKERSLLEVRELYYKINPHFLHNTLDTLKWYSFTKGQSEIANSISSLNKYLVYNLGEGEYSTIRQEIAAVEDYVVLQKIKYDIHLDLGIHVSEEELGRNLPRFTLQPLVENAILHGVEGEGTIYLTVDRTGDGRLRITVRDNGVGMPKETAEAILQSRVRQDGHGIGVNYVVTLLKHIYGNRCAIQINSAVGMGTEFIIILP